MITGWHSWDTWVTVNYPKIVITIMADLPNMNLKPLQGPSTHLGVPDGWAMDTFTRLKRFYGAAAHRAMGSSSLPNCGNKGRETPIRRKKNPHPKVGIFGVAKLNW